MTVGEEQRAAGASQAKRWPNEGAMVFAAATGAVCPLALATSLDSPQAAARAAHDWPKAPERTVAEQASGGADDRPPAPDMVRVPSGAFRMGSPDSEAGHAARAR